MLIPCFRSGGVWATNDKRQTTNELCGRKRLCQALFAGNSRFFRKYYNFSPCSFAGVPRARRASAARTSAWPDARTACFRPIFMVRSLYKRTYEKTTVLVLYFAVGPGAGNRHSPGGKAPRGRRDTVVDAALLFLLAMGRGALYPQNVSPQKRRRRRPVFFTAVSCYAPPMGTQRPLRRGKSRRFRAGIWRPRRRSLPDGHSGQGSRWLLSAAAAPRRRGGAGFPRR